MNFSFVAGLGSLDGYFLVETIVADEAVTKSLKMECPVLLVRLP